jgi:hypothetical protein
MISHLRNHGGTKRLTALLEAAEGIKAGTGRSEQHALPRLRHISRRGYRLIQRPNSLDRDTLSYCLLYCLGILTEDDHRSGFIHTAAGKRAKIGPFALPPGY